jgi:hypothetical protein
MASSNNVPVVQNTEKPIDAHPKPLRLVFHTTAALIMLNGFTGLTKVAVSKAIEPQVGRTHVQSPI